MIAAVTKAQMMGNKTQLKRVLSLLQTAGVLTDGIDENLLPRLREDVSLLSDDSDPSQLTKLWDQFSNLDEGGEAESDKFARSGLHQVKTYLLKELEAREKTGQPMSGSFARDWILKTQDRYNQWLSVL